MQTLERGRKSASTSQRYRSMRVMIVLLILLIPLGCSSPISGRASPSVPVVRVRLLEDQQRVNVAASESPTVIVGTTTARRMNLPAGMDVVVSLQPSGAWQVGNVTLGSGEMTLLPASEGSLKVNGKSYRGRYRLVPVSSGRFDVVNDVDVDGYLKSVVSKELLSRWELEAYRAQAIVARTYAIYVSETSPANRHFDLHDDQRSQVYGGIASESSKSRQSVDDTAGIVVVYDDGQREKIFKTYFSSCCGGVTQSATDAFGDRYLPPLSDQSVGPLCNASPKFNWAPVVLDKQEITRRIKLWGERRNRPEKGMGKVMSITVPEGGVSRWGRPVRFIVTDTEGVRYSLGGEEIRWAINTDASEGTTLSSSFFKLINEPDLIRFVEGHGFGHGVGMCQWCAQRRAEEGMSHEDIVLAAFQRAKLARMY